MKKIHMLGLALLLASTAVAHDEEKEKKEAPKFKSSISVGKAKESEFPGLAKLSFQQAIATALAEVKSPVIELKVELEDENGLIYSIEAKLANGTEMEVNIDAGTGKVLEVAKEEKKDKKDEKDEKDGEDKDGDND